MYKTGSLAGLQNRDKTMSAGDIKLVSANHLRRKACMPIMHHKVRIDVLSSHFVNTAAERETRQLNSQLGFATIPADFTLCSLLHSTKLHGQRSLPSIRSICHNVELDTIR